MEETADPIEVLGRIIGPKMAARFNFIDAATLGNAKGDSATVLAFAFEGTGRRLHVSECGRFFHRVPCTCDAAAGPSPR